MDKPNIVFILLDDYGWCDTGCYGSEFYETPNLDALAAAGMRFTDAYASCPVCSPTRASVMTGKYPATVGITDWIDWGGGCHPARGKLVDVPYLKDLPASEHTLASALKDGGYATWHVGKWHLGGEGSYPTDHGFDVNIGGSEYGCPCRGGYFSPWDLKNLDNAEDGKYLGDHMGDEAARLIRAHDGARPFYLNLCFYLVHTPIQGKPELVAHFEQKAKEMGLDQVEAFREDDFHPVEHKKDQRVKHRLVQSDPVYAAMVKSMDENVGKVLRALADTGRAQDTLVVFTSDNGGLATSEGSPTCNAPLQTGKGWMYEGGTREPLIVRWPGRTAAGATCDTPVTTPDFYPTLLEAAGLEPLPEQHVDGVSLVPLLTQTGGLEREAIFWHYPHYGNQGGTPGASIRAGDYKLIEFFEDNHVELYNLREDIGEAHDLSAELPEKAADLRERLHAWQRAVEAKIPQPNPDFEPWREADLNA